MSMSIIAVLVSLAMMLTGAGANGAPVSRTLTVSGVTLTVNGEEVALEPSLRLGVSSDGETALYDFAVDANGEALFPVQLAANAEGLTALFAGSGQAVQIPADALDALMEQAQAMMAGSVQADPQAAQLLTFLKDEYLPAYMGLIALAQDEARMEEIQAKGNALFDEMIDRGEGEADTLDIEDETYDVTRYAYTIGGEQMFALADAVYACDPALQAYYDALMKLYAMMPEESGLNGITSLSDLSARMGLDMTMDVVEYLNVEAEVDVMDAVITVDIPMPVAVADSEDGKGGEAPQLDPVVVNVHASKVGALNASNFDMDYTAEGVHLVMDGYAEQDETAADMNFNMTVEENGEALVTMGFTAGKTAAADSAAQDFYVNATAVGGDVGMALGVNGEVAADGAKTATLQANVSAETGTFAASVELDEAADGTGKADVDLAVDAGGTSGALRFTVAVTDAAVTDASEGAEVTVIDDLSQEGLQALTGDQGFQGKAMQVAGSFMADAQKLMADESVAKLAGLFTATAVSEEEEELIPLDGDDVEYEIEEGDALELDDDDYVIEMDDDLFDDEYDEEMEDDGVLPYEMPAFAWLPEGWEIVETNADTAYDTVDISISDESGDNSLYAMFYANPDDAQRYHLAEDGTLEPADNRVLSISNPEEGFWTVNVDDMGVYTVMYIYSDTLAMEDIGRIVAGLTY